jgi:hypothetical protein
MLIENTEKSSGVSEDVITEGDSFPIIPASGDRDGGNINSYPPAYSQAVGSTNYAVSPSVNNEKWHNQDQDYTAPPPGGPSTSSGTPIPAPTNYVHVFKRDGSIRGTWNIHPDLQIPTSFLLSSPTRADTNYAKSKIWKHADDNIPVDATGPQPNLMLHTRDGRVYADVWISDSAKQDESKPRQPTLLDLNTRDGKVTLRLVSNASRMFATRSR